MPTISAFYGIIVRMYFFDDRQHHAPHIHAECNDSHAVISILNGNVLAGKLPMSKARLVRAWIEIHKGELMANWKLAISGVDLIKIDPLR